MDAKRIVELASGPAIATDAGNRIVAWNHAAQRLFGYGEKSAAFAGKRLHELISINDAFGNPYRSDGQPFWELATRGDPVNPFELLLPQPDGPGLRLSVTAVVVLGAGDTDYSVVYLIRPMYRRRRADEAIDRILSMSTDELHRIVPGSGCSGHIEQQLTRREVEVLRLLAQGNASDEIAHTLNLSVHTVRSHVQHVLNKLEAHSKLEAVTKAFQLRLI